LQSLIGPLFIPGRESCPRTIIEIAIDIATDIAIATEIRTFAP